MDISRLGLGRSILALTLASSAAVAQGTPQPAPTGTRGGGGGPRGGAAPAVGTPPDSSGGARRGGGGGAGNFGGGAGFGAGVSAAVPRDIIAQADAAPSVTHHSVNVRGQTINYTAVAGMLPMRNGASGAVEGGMYYVAYLKDNTNASTRPITFTFNGGPGSASVWLHLGAFGPKKVKLTSEGSAPPPPYSYMDNENTLLDQTDLVFIDPIGTGYSRATSQQVGANFWGLDEDLRSVAEFIRLYLVRHDRMGSPKFLAGESYGTTRAAGLSGNLADDGIVMNGVVLLSTVLNFGYSAQTRGNDLGFIGFIPTYAATAWYHKKLPADLQSKSVGEVTSMAERWASNEYAAALMKGNKLTPAELKTVTDQMVRFTGLDRDVIEQNELRVALGTFDSELLRSDRQQVGRLDGRFTAYSPLLSGGGGGRGGGGGVGDPSEVVIRNTFTPVLTDYTRRELNYKNEDIYYILGGGIGRWNYPQNQYATVVPNLERAFAKNPYMRLFVAEGYYDAATPLGAVEYTLSHMSVDPKIAKSNITVERYSAGHMMYIDEPSMKKLRSDLEKFFNAATRQ
ncbi:MAG: peptidase serine carboxypeptidase [Gemmatimonadetes bacterium]|nr:peptidase serine carboxypeptidase [Gemmatimonadota bacterium]